MNRRKRWNDREISRLLTNVPDGSPPADLLSRLQADIPETIETVVRDEKSSGSRAWARVRPLYRVAAVLFVTVGAGILMLPVRMKEAVPPISQPAREPMQQANELAMPDPPVPATAMPKKADAAEAVISRRVQSNPLTPDSDSAKPTAVVLGVTSNPVLSFSSAFDAAPVAPVPPVNSSQAAGDYLKAMPPSTQREYSRVLSAHRSMSLTAGSTGGTAEPNDKKYGHVFFESSGTNPFLDTADDARSTFALDVDTGSYTIGRQYLTNNALPEPASVRVEEYLNFFDYKDPAPRKEDFAITIEGGPSYTSRGPDYRYLRIGVKAATPGEEERKTANLTFVIDVSGSMQQGNRLGLVKSSLRLLVNKLTHRDRVALVVYGSNARIVLPPTRDRDALLRAIDGLVAEGSTNAEEGLVTGYKVAEEMQSRGAINRVILCSDGVANVGRTGPDSILGRIKSSAERGIELTTVGFGMGNYNDVLMERLADTGNGRYAYVDTEKEAHRLFVEELTGVLQTVAYDSKTQVVFNPKAVSRFRLVGYENRAIENDRFRDDTVDAGEVGAGHTVTALYEVKLVPNAGSQTLATVHLRYRPAEATKHLEVTRTIGTQQLAKKWSDTSRSFQLAVGVATYAEVLKKTYWAKNFDLRDLAARLDEVAARWPDDERVQELGQLARKAAELSRPPEER